MTANYLILSLSLCECVFWCAFYCMCMQAHVCACVCMLEVHAQCLFQSLFALFLVGQHLSVSLELTDSPRLPGVRARDLLLPRQHWGYKCPLLCPVFSVDAGN